MYTQHTRDDPEIHRIWTSSVTPYGGNKILSNKYALSNDIIDQQLFDLNSYKLENKLLLKCRQVPKGIFCFMEVTGIAIQTYMYSLIFEHYVFTM